MQLGTVIGYATATIKHPSLNGWRMALVQLLNRAKLPEGEAVIAVDSIGSRSGDTVLLNSDGKAARDLIGDQKSPVRWFVIGILD